MRQASFIILILISLAGYSQNKLELLSKAYKHKSLDELKEFFENWHNDLNSKDYSDSNELKKIAYEIFVSFYKPFELNNIEIGNQPLMNLDSTTYVVLQNSLDIYQVNIFALDINSYRDRIPNDNELIGMESIMDYRPYINLPNTHTLYLTNDYKNVLLNFLGDSHSPFRFMNPSKPTGKSLKKQKFINNYLKISYGHWGGYWDLETPPKVSWMIINKSKTIAIIRYKQGYYSGFDLFIYKNNEWVFKESGLGWLE